VVCFLLGWLGAKPAEGIYVIAARVATAYYFAHFLLVLPLLGLFERPTPMPNSIAESVLGHPVRGAAGMPVGAAAEPQAKG
jgi:ubiquinol-cytochrome c reductase cytochrome b subunit